MYNTYFLLLCKAIKDLSQKKKKKRPQGNDPGQPAHWGIHYLCHCSGTEPKLSLSLFLQETVCELLEGRPQVLKLK